MIEHCQPMRNPLKRLSSGRRAGFLAGLLVVSILLVAPFARTAENPREDLGPKLSSVEIHDFEKEIDLLIRQAEEASAGTEPASR